MASELGKAKGLQTGLQTLVVKVPIGASTGKLIVLRYKPVPMMGNVFKAGEWIPSNSIDFKVTTQFGLLARWYKLKGESNPSFVEPGSREPDATRVERWISNWDHADFNAPFPEKSFAVHFEGRIGIPAAQKPIETKDASELQRYLHFHTAGHLRVKLGNVVKSHDPANGMIIEGSELKFELPWGEEQFLPISIDYVNDAAAGVLVAWFGTRAFYEGREGASSGRYWLENVVLPPHLMFPPVTPPKPPRIASVIPITIAGDEPPTPPFPAAPSLVSVREGQQFKCNVEIFGDEEVRAAPVTLSVDGHVIECGSGTLIDDSASKRWFRQFVGVLPAGCGEGKLTAKLGLSTSEPYYIDVANKGLIAYLYDLPNPSGYARFPNILPLTCHTIRKEREINFGTADSFNLPFVAETFAVEWYGAIIIEQDGWYTFTSRTDDGCRVWLNGIEIIDDDNLHAPQEKSSDRIKLVAGTYPFRMQFFENNMHEECLLFVAAVDLQEKELMARQLVPKRMFTWEVHDMLPDKVATGKKADGSE